MNVATLAICLFLIGCSFIRQGRGGLIRSKRIVNGHTAREGSVPWMVSLFRTSQLVLDEDDDEAPVPYCGGSLVSTGYGCDRRTFVVTAGHCLANKRPQDVKVVLDLYSVNDKVAENISSVAYDVESIFVYPDYDDRQKQPMSDIAVATLKDFFSVANHLKSLSLPPPDLEINETEHLVVSGWGRLGRSQAQSRTLQTLSGLSRDDSCTWLYGDAFLNDHICLRDVNGTRRRWTDICRGDSGGPLVEFDSRVLVGLVSFGTCLGVPASVFTRVSYYTQWLKNITSSALEAKGLQDKRNAQYLTLESSAKVLSWFDTSFLKWL